MVPKEKVIAEIQRLAREIGKPPGQKLFQKETGYSHSYWGGTYWPRWSAALEEAGFTPNERNAPISEDDLLDRYLSLVIEMGSIPTMGELRLKARTDKGFPAASTFVKRLGTQSELLPKAYERAKKVGLPTGIVQLLASRQETQFGDVEREHGGLVSGIVYLLKSGDFFKIGRSTEIERRVKEISVALPEKLELIHSIQTDDTVGIEGYWHRRFADKRMNGEWFKLSRNDVAAFKRRKFQ